MKEKPICQITNTEIFAVFAVEKGEIEEFGD
jgi:hypothetical protein